MTSPTLPPGSRGTCLIAIVRTPNFSSSSPGAAGTARAKRVGQPLHGGGSVGREQVHVVKACSSLALHHLDAYAPRVIDKGGPHSVGILRRGDQCAARCLQFRDFGFRGHECQPEVIDDTSRARPGGGGLSETQVDGAECDAARPLGCRAEVLRPPCGGPRGLRDAEADVIEQQIIGRTRHRAGGDRNGTEHGNDCRDDGEWALTHGQRRADSSGVARMTVSPVSGGHADPLRMSLRDPENHRKETERGRETRARIRMP